MVIKNFIRVIPVIMLVFVMIIIGCDLFSKDDGGGEEEGEDEGDSTELPVLSGTVAISGFTTPGPREGETLTATYSGGNGSGAETWKWYRVDETTSAAISGATTNIYKLVPADVDKTIKAEVSFAGQTGSKTSDPTTVVIAETRDALTGTVKIIDTEGKVINTPRVDDILIADYENGNGTGNPTYQWIRVSGSTETNIGTNHLIYIVVEADVGKTIKVQVSFDEQSGNRPSSLTSTVAAALPILTGSVSITPSTAPKVGDTLTATYSGGNGTGITKYQWIVDSKEIEDATNSTYIVTPENEGKRIKVKVSYADKKGSRESKETVAVTMAALTGSVTITPSTAAPKVGDTLTANYSGGNGNGNIAYQWIADSVDITDATSKTYVVDSEDVGKKIKVRVSYSNQTGNVTSAETADVTEAGGG